MLEQRIERIYAALGAAVERDMTKLPATIRKTKKMVFFSQNFSGGRSQAELENLAQSLIYNIAHLYDHLRKWAKANERNVDSVDETIRGSNALQVICDLANVDKHGAAGRRTWSGKRLRLANVTRVLRLTTRPEKESWVGARLGRIPKISGNGSAAAILTGEILDQDGNNVGDLHEVANEAVEAWEKVLDHYGVGI